MIAAMGLNLQDLYFDILPNNKYETTSFMSAGPIDGFYATNGDYLALFHEHGDGAGGIEIAKVMAEGNKLTMFRSDDDAKMIYEKQ